MNVEQLDYLADSIGQKVRARWLDAEEAARYCGVSRSHFNRHIRLSARDCHGKKVYDRRELDSYMERLARWGDQR
jgi:hypothetical protein